MAQAAVERKRRQEDRSATRSCLLLSPFLKNPFLSSGQPLDDLEMVEAVTPTMGLGSPSKKGQTIDEHALQDQFPALRCGRGYFGDSNSSG